MKHLFFGYRLNIKEKIRNSLILFGAIFAVAWPVSSIVYEFNTGLWKLPYDLPLFSKSFLIVFSFFPFLSLYSSLKNSRIVSNIGGFSVGNYFYRWVDVDALYTRYLYVVLHRYYIAGHSKIYNGSVNRIYKVLLVKSKKKDIQIGVLQKSFSNYHTHPEENELFPFSTDVRVDLRLEIPLEVYALRKPDFESFVNLLMKNSGKQVESLMI